MDRRQFVAAGVCAAVGSVAGCLTSEDSEPATESERTVQSSATERTVQPTERVTYADWDPTIEGEDVDVAPGESAILELQAQAVAAVTAANIPHWDRIEIEMGYEHWSPPPTEVEQMYPPNVYWDGHQTLSGRLGIVASPDADPGQYPFALEFHDRPSHGGRTVVREFPITVL